MVAASEAASEAHLLAVCDPAQTLAFEFFLCDDADELFGVSCGDALTDDDAEMIDDETFED
jgi:hypothetical protein